MIRIAAIQMTSGAEVPANLAEAGRLIAQAASTGVALAVLPENFALMPVRDHDRLAAMEADGRGPIQEFLSAQARKHRIWLLGGTVALAAREKNKVRAASLLIDDRGERVARYDKIHLFDVNLESGEEYRESSYIEPGEQITVADTPVGRLGLAVCYDLRFPELFRRMLDEGAELFSVPAAFTATTGKAHWEVLVRARAIENLAFIVAPAQSGTHANGRQTHGDTMIVGPWGEILARRTHAPGYVTAEIDRARLLAVRQSLPSLRHRKYSYDGTAADCSRLSA